MAAWKVHVSFISYHAELPHMHMGEGRMANCLIAHVGLASIQFIV